MRAIAGPPSDAEKQAPIPGPDDPAGGGTEGWDDLADPAREVQLQHWRYHARQAIPDGADVTILHYRKREILGDAGLKGKADQYLADQLGTRLVRWIFKVPPPPGIEPLPVALPDMPPTREFTVEPEASVPAKPDPSKAGLAVVTMVRGEHDALRRWIDYYAPLVGPGNLYVLRHGENPEIDRIADGTNLIHIPDMGDDSGLDQRKFATLSQFCSGLTLYYNWVLCVQANEIVVPDPDTGMNLPEYLNRLSVDGNPPDVLAPFGIELISAEAPMRAYFRINTKYVKPCLTRRRILFAPDGNGSNIRDVKLDPLLILFSVKQSGAQADKIEPTELASDAADIAIFEAADKMRTGPLQHDQSGPWQFAEIYGTELYCLPAKFDGLF